MRLVLNVIAMFCVEFNCDGECDIDLTEPSEQPKGAKGIMLIIKVLTMFCV